MYYSKHLRARSTANPEEWPTLGHARLPTQASGPPRNSTVNNYNHQKTPGSPGVFFIGKSLTDRV